VVAEPITAGVSMSLMNKVAIVTSGNSGVGKAIALELAKTFGDGGCFTVALKGRREDS
jgi:NAD(P)-dependent dehydrogenase (short-subunit alcohol dehydrogenase family)